MTQVNHSPPFFCERVSQVDFQDQQVDVLIIGAGPTGLGAAKRLEDLVYQCHIM
jgi:ribulose 1,5-bisphosphate synthetase/thiazole synthase